MTKSIKLITAVVIFLMTTPLAFAQHSSCHSTLTRSIKLDNSSKKEEIKIEVADDVKCLGIGLNSTISEGSLTVEIFDPNGDKQGNFSVESQMSSSSSSEGKNSEMVCGQLNKTIKEPMKGDWVVKLKPKKVTGKIQINSYQSDKPGS
ncbi:MAG: hypothetical protein AAF466_09400 [Bacteroidota bacterium]